MNTVNLETKITDFTVEVIKDQIVYELDIIFRVYRDTNPTDRNFHLPPGVNLQEVAEGLFFLDERVGPLHEIHLDLVSRGTQSDHFVQALQFLLG